MSCPRNRMLIHRALTLAPIRVSVSDKTNFFSRISKYKFELIWDNEKNFPDRQSSQNV